MQLLLRLFLEHLRNNHSLEPNPVLSIYHLILQVEACSSPKLRQPLIRLSALKITALLLLSWVVSPFQRPALLAHSVLPAYNIVCFSKFLQMRSVSHKSCWNLLKGSALFANVVVKPQPLSFASELQVQWFIPFPILVSYQIAMVWTTDQKLEAL